MTTALVPIWMYMPFFIPEIMCHYWLIKSIAEVDTRPKNQYFTLDTSEIPEDDRIIY